MTQENGSEPIPVGEAVSDLVRSLDRGRSMTQPSKSLVSESFESIRERRSKMTPEELEDERKRIDQRSAEQRQAEREAQRKQAAKSCWDSTIRQIGRRYSNCSLENFSTIDPRQFEAVRTLRELVERLPEHSSSGGGIAFIGPMGTGKDHLAVAMLFEAASKHSMTVGWCDGQMLFQDFRDRIGEDAREADKIRELVSPDILLISDPIPQSGSLTEFQQSILWRVIDRRYRNAQPTWVTMNVANREEAEKRLGAQIVDRLSDGAVNIVCSWGSHRKAAA